MPWPRGSVPAISLRVLVIDDDERDRRTLAELIQMHGHVVEMAAGGREALDWARRSPPDLVLVDLDMPGMNGREVAARIAADPLLGVVPVIVFTKPINVPALLELVVSVTAARGGAVRRIDPQLQQLRGPHRNTPMVEGITRVRDHCTFRWVELGLGSGMRTIQIGPQHCHRCIVELRSLWPGAHFDLIPTDAE